jgi:hypothetical protein
MAPLNNVDILCWSSQWWICKEELLLRNSLVVWAAKDMVTSLLNVKKNFDHIDRTYDLSMI